jgi:biotin carboxyl carrier protein
MTARPRHFSSSGTVYLVQSTNFCGRIAVFPASALNLFSVRRTAALLLVALLAVAVACSNDTKAAPTKEQVAVDPNLFRVEKPDLFRTVKVESRDLPTELNANGSVQPDVNKTIHVTSLGSGRVVELKARLGDYVKKGQVLLVISAPTSRVRLATTRKHRPTRHSPPRLSTAPNCSIRAARSRRKIWRSPRTLTPRRKPIRRLRRTACGFSAEIPRIPAR